MQEPLNSELLQLTCDLIAEQSITPFSARCFTIIERFCQDHQLHYQRLDCHDTQNLFITTQQSKQFRLLLSGHIDVVPPGDIKQWSHNPFQASIRDDILYGRGAVDMKSSVAAMLIAIKHMLQQKLECAPVALLLTSDEEGVAQDGTRYAIDQLIRQGYQFQYALVGEPTSVESLGDTVKTGRRGSLSGHVTIVGKQSHVAYAEHNVNPIFALSQFIHDAKTCVWDEGFENFPSTQFCATSFESRSPAGNVTPAKASCHFNFRFSPASTHASLKKQVNDMLEDSGLHFEIKWSPPSHAFYKKPGHLTKQVIESIATICDIEATLSTSGGTSDARFLAAHVEEIIEIGPKNNTAHQIDEHIPIHDLQRLCSLYTDILMRVTR